MRLCFRSPIVPRVWSASGVWAVTKSISFSNSLNSAYQQLLHPINPASP